MPSPSRIIWGFLGSFGKAIAPFLALIAQLQGNACCATSFWAASTSGEGVELVMVAAFSDPEGLCAGTNSLGLARIWVLAA